jgi:DNA-directed RNA polymerase specialized sigma subunit
MNTVLADIFDRNIERRFESVEVEVAAIASAKAGDEQAVIDLMYAYTFALNNALGKFRNAGGGNRGAYGDSTEERRSLAVMGFMEAIHAFDPEKHTRLSAIVGVHLVQEIGSMVGPIAFTVPQRTLTRFFSILRMADGDLAAGAKLAPEYSMTSETFQAVAEACRTTSHGIPSAGDPTWETDVSPLWSRADKEEDDILVMAAFSAVDDLEGQVVSMAYGFDDYDPIADAEVAHRMGLSRPKVQRVRSSALGKMREALGVS